MLEAATSVVTTMAGAARVSDKAVGLAPWQSHDTPTPDGRVLRITATPARHGPSDGDRGPVTGFILAFTGRSDSIVYISGDTVWYEDVAEVSRRYQPAVAMLFAGAARVREVGPAHLTFTAAETVEAARAFRHSLVMPVHVEGWAHFSDPVRRSTRPSTRPDWPIDRRPAVRWNYRMPFLAIQRDRFLAWRISAAAATQTRHRTFIGALAFVAGHIRSLDHDLARHPRMDGAEVLVGAGRLELVRELAVRIENGRLELPLRADDVVRYVVVIGPGDSCADCD